MYLNSNQDLYDYLTRLAEELRGRKATVLGDVLLHASAQAASSSTEFLGESRIALRRLLRDAEGVLSKSEQADVEDILKQLTAALNRWPQKPR